MGVDFSRVIELLEIAAFLLPDLPGRVETFEADGVLVRSTWDSDPFANLVGAAKLSPHDADAVIADIVSYFADQRKAFGWLVGPQSMPLDLAHRLARAGLNKVGEYAGMVNWDPSVFLPTNPAVHVWEVGPADFETAAWLMAEGMGVSIEQTRAVTEALFFGADSIGRRVYFAALDGAPHPVAFGSMVYVPDEPAVHLSSAATLDGFRGHGLYSALVARRLADAHQDGAEVALIHANRATSAPICRKLGFTEVAGLTLFAWYPGS